MLRKWIIELIFASSRRHTTKLLLTYEVCIVSARGAGTRGGRGEGGSVGSRPHSHSSVNELKFRERDRSDCFIGVRWGHRCIFYTSDEVRMTLNSMEKPNDSRARTSFHVTHGHRIAKRQTPFLASAQASTFRVRAHTHALPTPEFPHLVWCYWALLGLLSRTVLQRVLWGSGEGETFLWF